MEISKGIIKNYSPLASHDGHILALLLLHISADRTWDLLADRVSHLSDSECKNKYQVCVKQGLTFMRQSNLPQSRLRWTG